MRLRAEAERRLVMTSLQECRAELQREEKMLATAGSERVIREHRVKPKTERKKRKEKMTYRLESLERINTRSRPCLLTQAFFRNKNPISACERRLKTMEQLCQKLPENDATQKALPETRDSVSEVKGEVERAHVRLQENPDKWSEWHRR